jgi:drug/metabolite transporter (DMT)-like permease
MNEKIGPLEALLGMTLTGLLIGLGQLLSSDEKLTPRIVIGRALSSSGLALVAGLSLLQIPDMPLVPLIALSALIASLGTSALEKVLQHYFGIKPK